MSDENISIQIKDGIDPTISTKLKAIAKDALAANAGVVRLQVALNGISTSSGLQKLQTELAKTGLAEQKLQTQISKTNEAYFKSEAALNKAIAAEAKAAAATAQLAAAQTNSTIAAQRLTTATAQSAAATARAQAAAIATATATTKAATAQTQSQIAAQALAAATTRTNTAQTQGQLIAQKLATAQVANGTATANATNATNRAALSALRLQQAQARASLATQNATTSLWGYIKAGAAALGIGYGVKEILAIADSYTTLQNRLRNITDSQAQNNFLTKELIKTSNEARVSVLDLVTIYARYDAIFARLGASQKESLRFTKTLSEEFKINGANAQESASGLLQVAQALNRGKLQGEDFRTLMHYLGPDVQEAIRKIADPSGKANLQDLSTQGKITAQVLRQAIASIADEADKKIGKTAFTISDAFVIFKNNVVVAIGELNKSLGVTDLIAKSIIFLSQHLDILAASALTVGVALLVAFGPALLTALTAVWESISAITIAIATNPIGALIVGITAGISAFILFGDKIKVTSDGLVSLKDVALAVWYYIKQAALITINFIAKSWEYLSNFIADKFGGLFTVFKDVNKQILESVKTVVNDFIGVWVFGFEVVSKLWKAGPSGFKKAFSEIGDLAKSVFNEDYLADFGKSLSKGFDSATKGLMERAREIAKARKAAEDQGSAKLRGEGPNTIAESPDKAAEKRALALAKINKELDDQTARLFVLQPAREAQAKLDQIEESLLGKKIKLTEDERATINSKITAIQTATEVQKQFDAVYNESVGPLRIYNATIEASEKLLSQGAITQEQYSRAVLKASEAYANFKDPLRQYNRDLNDQFQLLLALPKQREIDQQVIQLQNRLLGEGIVLDAQQIANIRERLELLQEQSDVNQHLNQIYSETQGAQLSLEQQATALDEAWAGGLITLDDYSNRLVKLSVNMANLRLQMEDGSFTDFITASLGTLVSEYKGALAEMTSSLGNFFKTFEDGFANAIGHAIVFREDLTDVGDAIKSIAKNAIAELIGSLIKLGIQFVINAALGKSVETGALAAHVALSTGAAAATAAAWAPAAALVSLASFGANSAPASAGIAATAGLSESLALTSLAGFKDGGFTGYSARDKIAGVVHGSEFVMDAETTSRVGKENLQALQSGAASIQRNSNVGQSNWSPVGTNMYGDFNVTAVMPKGSTRDDGEKVGAGIADGFLKRMQEQKRLEKEANFHGVKQGFSS